MVLRRPLDPRGLQSHPYHIAVGRNGPSSHTHLLFKHSRLCYALRASPTTNPAAAVLPPHFPSAISRRDTFTGRHAVPYPITQEWNSTRAWGRPPLHIETLPSLLAPWSDHAFPVRGHVGLPRPLTLPSLPTKEGLSLNQVFPLPPLRSSSSLTALIRKKSRRRLRPPPSARRHHRAPPSSVRLHRQAPPPGLPA